MEYCIDCGVPTSECPCNEDEHIFSLSNNSPGSSQDKLFDERDYAAEADY